jgi:uncharacterized protein (TIGR02996 family)
MLTIGDVLRDRHTVDAVARGYPLSDETIAAYADVLDWKALSRNTELAWSEELIERYNGRWDWEGLEWNPALPWSVPFVRKYVDAGRFTWSRLRWQSAMVRDPALVELCFPHWIALPQDEWTAGSHDEYGGGPFDGPLQFTRWGDAPWAHRLIENMPGLQWHYFSCVEGFPWTEEFIAKHADRLDWHRLSWNQGLPWNVGFMQRFADRIDWDRAAYRVPWTAELVRVFGDRIDWRVISDDLTWTPQLIEELAARIYWAEPDMDIGGWEGTFSGMFQHEVLEWTPERFERLKPHLEAHFARVFREDRDLAGDGDEGDDDEGDDEVRGDPDMYWTAYCNTSNWSPEFFDYAIALGERIGMTTIDWQLVSRAARTPWTDEFVARHADKLVVYELLGNKHFPMAHYLPYIADRFDAHEWKWLGGQTAFTPTAEVLARYADRFDWKELSSNPNLTPEIIEANVDRWNWSELADNKVMTRDLAVRLRAHIPKDVLAKKFRELVPEGEAPARQTLRARASDQPLDDRTVSDLLTAVRGDRAMDRQPGLEAAIEANPSDPGVYAPYADWLQQRGDPQGELIALMVAAASDPSLVDEVALAIARYRERLELEMVRTTWRFGFADEVYGIAKDWQRHLASRAFQFVRGLALSDSAARELEPDDLGIIAKLTRLERLALRFVKLERFDALRGLSHLRDLWIDHSAVRDLGFIAALPLEQLSLWNTGIADLTGIARAPTLTGLHAGHNPITDLSPLRGLDRLVELDIRYSHVHDLEPLESLPALRLLRVEASRATADEIARFSHARPEVEIVSYATWPGTSKMLPFWDSTYWKPL